MPLSYILGALVRRHGQDRQRRRRSGPPGRHRRVRGDQLGGAHPQHQLPVPPVPDGVSVRHLAAGARPLRRKGGRRGGPQYHDRRRRALRLARRRRGAHRQRGTRTTSSTASWPCGTAKHCLIEKPAALCFRDIDRLVAAEKEAAAAATTDGKVVAPRVFVGTMRRFARAFLDTVEEVGSMGRVTLGTHDLSAMREMLGMPVGVAGATLTLPEVFCVLFDYGRFGVTYESGLNSVPDFDAHIEVYSADKIVRVEFDSPYVKGLPTTMAVRERTPGADGGFQERRVRRTYTDAYTLELQELYRCVVEGREVKTSAADARKDIELFQMILRAGAAKLQGSA
ncbi:hypothetical protein RB597_009503 [Gaeumannomyces tritici]